MAALIGRGLLAFVVAIICAVVLAILGSYMGAEEMACQPDACALGDYLAQLAGFAIILGYVGFFLAFVMVVPFLIIYVILVRAGAANAATFALCGVLFALFFMGVGPPLGEGPLPDTQGEIFRANLTSSVGIGAMIIGALSGVAAWAVNIRTAVLIDD